MLYHITAEYVLLMVDDVDEPMMEGSDDKFGDIQEEVEVELQEMELDNEMEDLSTTTNLQSDAMDVAPESIHINMYLLL